MQKQNHINRDADITVSCVPVGGRSVISSVFFFLNDNIVLPIRFVFVLFSIIFLEQVEFFCLSRASDFGLMKIDSRGQVIQFAEKPKGADLKAMVSIYDPL